MNKTYLGDPARVLSRFDAWWSHEKIGRPLLRVVAKKRGAAELPDFQSLEAKYLDVDAIVARQRAYFESRVFLGDAYPSLSLDLGPGSMALYLGGEPVFAEDTVWYRESLESPEEFQTLRYDPQNPWLVRHLSMIRRAVALASGDFLINIPDIIENLDILSALRGPQNLCYDLADDPELVKAGVEKIDECYFRYYDAFYDQVKDSDGSSSFTAFDIWGSGRTAKIQCDFCALISPRDFRALVQPSLQKQCRRLDHTVYHLDGPDARRHLDALMEIEELDALQWTCGAGQPDGASERWYPIYDKVAGAGKSLWIRLEDGTPDDWYKNAMRLVSLYGADRLYLLFPEFDDERAARDFVSAMGEV